MSYSKPSSTSITPTNKVIEETEEAVQQQITLEKENVPTVVLASEMVGSKSNAVTDVFVEALTRYKNVLAGNLVLNKSQLKEEQAAFMNTVSNTMNLEFKDYVLTTDALVLLMRDNKEAFNEKRLYELFYYVQGDYSKKAAERYMRYMSALYTLSQNLRNRSRIGKMVDIVSLSSGYTTKAATNIQNYFNCNYG